VSEWQRARYVHAHRDANDKPVAVENLSKMVIHVRPAKPSRLVILEYRRTGCDARKFFQVQAEDADAAHESPQRGMAFVCEHEILTD
jgi:hypothetical protein